MKIYVYGCSKKFELKKNEIVKKYDIELIFDNYITESVYCLGNIQIPIGILEKEIENYPILIMRNEFISAWKEIRKKGIENQIIFSYEIGGLDDKEEVLFSNGEKLLESKGHLYYLDSKGKEFLLDKFNNVQQLLQRVEVENNKAEWIKVLGLSPNNRTFGFSRGTPIDRYYIENWLEKNKYMIYGDVLEIAEDTYTKKYGQDRVKKSYMLHVAEDKPPYIKGNFETGEGIKEESVDCIILTQTIPFIFDIQSAMTNIYKMLTKNGRCIITVSGISQISRYDMDRWGEYWRFTNLSLRNVAEKAGFDVVEMQNYGNVKIATAMLYGLAAEELDKKELNYIDDDYQVIICATLIKH